MSSIEQLKVLVIAYEAKTAIKRVTLSWRLFDDSKKLDAIMEENKDLHTKRFDAAIGWFSANWPEDLDWPDEIGRPQPTEAAA